MFASWTNCTPSEQPGHHDLRNDRNKAGHDREQGSHDRQEGSHEREQEGHEGRHGGHDRDSAGHDQNVLYSADHGRGHVPRKPFLAPHTTVDHFDVLPSEVEVRSRLRSLVRAHTSDFTLTLEF